MKDNPHLSPMRGEYIIVLVLNYDISNTIMLEIP